jgi:hypothetical protein
MALRIRRGTDAQRTGKTFEMGEIVYTIDAHQMWVGDGSTQGGIPVVGSNVTGYGLTYNNTTHKIEVSGLTADDIANGINNKFFSTELAQDAAASLFTTGSHSHISFAYDDTTGKINATVALDGVGLTDVVNDTSPSLGGSLDLNSNDITGTGNIDITGEISATAAIYGLSINTETGSITTADITALNTADIHVPDSSLGMEITSKLGNSFAVGYYGGSNSVKTAVPKATGGMVMSVKGWTGTLYQFAAGIGGQWDADANLNDSSPKSTVAIFGGAGGDNNTIATLDSSGVFSSAGFAAGDGTAQKPSIAFTTDGGVDSGFFHPGDGIVCVTINTTEKARFDGGGLRVDGFIKVKNVEGTLPNPPEAGMIVLDGTTFKGYNGSAWVDLN